MEHCVNVTSTLLTKPVGLSVHATVCGHAAIPSNDINLSFTAFRALPTDNPFHDTSHNSIACVQALKLANDKYLVFQAGSTTCRVTAVMLLSVQTC